MLIKIGEFEFTECWDGVLYKKLSDYPKITDWEKQTVLDFIRYESEYGRTCEIEAEESILHAIDTYRASYEKGNRVTPPIKITECTACPKYKGCMTDLVCHTSPVDSRGGQQDHDQIPGFIRAIHEQGTGQRLSKAQSPQSPE